MWLGFLKYVVYNMFNSDKVKNNEVQGYLFFTPMSRLGAIFLHLPYDVRVFIGEKICGPWQKIVSC